MKRPFGRWFSLCGVTGSSLKPPAGAELKPGATRRAFLELEFPGAIEFDDPSSILGVCIEPCPRLANHLGTEGAIGKSSLARSNLSKARIDPSESRAHLGMNVLEHRARSHVFFRLGENASRSVCLDGPTREFTRRNALAPGSMKI